jgi:C4-dicarboxylate-specific signal transduction histidine kinase
MTATLHKLLQRQLRRAFGSIEATPPGLEGLLGAVSQAYADADAARTMIERTLELTSRELNERNEQLRADLVERQHARDELQRRSDEQQALIRHLEDTRNQLLQAEKMASIGQLAAGVAHEINNPIGYVGSNLGTLREYVGALLAIVAEFESRAARLPAADAAALERTL